MQKHYLLKTTGRVLLMFALVLLSVYAFAQVPVSGRVTSTDATEGLPGVNVIVKGTTDGTVTDAEGKYSLTVPSQNSVIVFSFVGYLTEEITVGTQTTVDMVLVPDIATLGEIVIVGYGTQKKTSMTSAVSQISSEEVNSRQAPNTISLLQGRTPGLQITQNSAQPGAESNQIRIRGFGTFSGAGVNPLVLIDGVEGKLELLNPNNIEEISVLKDAASAAIYGSRAANGVILVTTKKGKEGRLNIEYNYNYSTQTPSIKVRRITDPLEYMELVNQAIDYSNNMNSAWRYTDAEKSMYAADTIPTADWTKYLFRTAPIHKHYLNLNGGKAGTTFNAGLGILDETGILLATDFKRYDAQINFKTDVGSRVSFGNNIALARSKRHDTVFDRSTPADLLTSNASEDQMLAALAAPPISIPVLPDGSGRFTGTVIPNKGGNKNPIAVASAGGKEWITTYLLFSPYVNVKITDDLTAEVKGALRFEEESAKAFLASVDTYEFFPPHARSGSTASTNSLFHRNTRENQYTLYGTLNYRKTFSGMHNLNALLGYQQENYRMDQLDAFRSSLPSLDIWEIDIGSPAVKDNGGTANEWAIQSFFGRLAYDFKDKYLFEASFRNDASSRFPEGNRWAFFPSVSAGWRIGEESFTSDLTWMDDLKLRVSWGQLGNQNVGNYPYQNSMTSTVYNFNGSLFQGFTMRDIIYPDIRWELTTVTDIGLDFGFFEGKLTGSVDWYNKLTTDILRELQVPSYIGINGPTMNNGEIQNRGWEFLIGHKNKLGDFGYGINANLDMFKNKLLKFGAREISGVNLREEGEPYNQYYVLLMDGIYQTQEEVDNGPIPQYSTNPRPKPGALKYKDVSGPDGVPDGQVDLTYDRVPVEGLYPKFSYGVNLTADYKGFDLSVFVQGVHGRKTYVTGWGVAPFQQASAPPVWWRDSWTTENPSNTVPHIFMDGWAPNNQVSTFWLGNSSYMRIKNVQLGYSIPSAWAKKVFMQSFRIYAAADNLYTRTKFFQGLDPERTATGNARASIYPQATIYSFGVRAVF